ncbi:MAG TPA: hypothetical protein VMV18_03070 [bacterium]|nr:hypothetical protein [bacterium]
MLLLASLVFFAQAEIVADPFPLPQGCARLSLEMGERLGDVIGATGPSRAREACYEQLGKGFTNREVAEAMHAWEAQLAGFTRAPGDPVVAADAWVEFLAHAPSPVRSPTFEPRVDDAAIARNVAISYWGSCDGRGRQGACDQMAAASFRFREGTWAQMRYFDLYADNDTAGAVGLGFDNDASDGFGYTAGIWVGTWAKGCAQEGGCERGAPFALPYFDVHAGSPMLFVEASLFDGPYISSGHSRLEIGHDFADRLRVMAGATAGVFGYGAAARADARLYLVHGHVALDGYASGGARGFALGGGAAVRY